MISSFVDLHCHSIASDGTLTPAQVIQEAKRAGLSAISLTDHDTIAGIDEASMEARRLGIDFLPGIEISCQYPSPGTMHLLGYGIDPGSRILRDMMHSLVEARTHRNERIIDALNSQGVAVTLQEVQGNAAGEVVGRPHFANVLLEKGYVSSRKLAFDKYLGPGGSAYFDKERFTSRQAIDLIHAAHGKIVLAHPVQLRAANPDGLFQLIRDLKKLGLDGIETVHSDHDDAMTAGLTKMADEFGLLKTGGSDFHGNNKSDVRLGFARGRRIPREMFDQLVQNLQQSECNGAAAQ